MAEKMYRVPDLNSAEVKILLDSLKVNKVLLETRVAISEEVSLSSRIGLLKEAALCDELCHRLTLDMSSRALEGAHQRRADLQSGALTPDKPKPPQCGPDQ